MPIGDDVERCERCERAVLYAGAPHDCRSMQERIAALAARAKAEPPRTPIRWRAPELVEVPDDQWRERRDLD